MEYDTASGKCDVWDCLYECVRYCNVWRSCTILPWESCGVRYYPVPSKQNDDVDDNAARGDTDGVVADNAAANRIEYPNCDAENDADDVDNDIDDDVGNDDTDDGDDDADDVADADDGNGDNDDAFLQEASKCSEQHS